MFLLSIAGGWKFYSWSRVCFCEHYWRICPLCADKNLVLDYKNADQLRKFINDKGKILPRRATGACAIHQRDITLAVKRARQIAAGSTPLTKKDEPSPVSLAADEIAEGKVKPC